MVKSFRDITRMTLTEVWTILSWPGRSEYERHDREVIGGGETKHSTLKKSSNTDDDLNRISKRSIQKTGKSLAEFQR